MSTKKAVAVTRRTSIAVLPAAVITWSAQAQDFRSIQRGQDVRPRNRAEFDQRHQNQGSHGFVGMWITADGNIRHNLLPGGRYDEARGTRESAYCGRYIISGNLIDYVDDTGFIADGEFRDDALYHAGMIMYRNGQRPR
jgi:Agrobacterium tumefaciens protein Atu4866